MAESDEQTPQDVANFGITVVLVGVVLGACGTWLAQLPEDSYQCFEGMTGPTVKYYNLLMAIGSSSLLLWHYSDPDPLKVRYTVLGRPEITPLHREFLGIQRWSTFTAWSNTSCTLFLCCAAVLGFTASPSLCLVNQVLWELTFPLAFFVNIVVSFVLIPQIKKMRDAVKLQRILRLKPQLLHNGLALAGALEAMLAAPPLVLSHFPILVLFATLYIVFAWCFFQRTGIFHYNFLDHRFKYEPLALLLLLFLLASVYCLGSVALHFAADSMLARVLILLAALATCTFTPGTELAHGTDALLSS